VRSTEHKTTFYVIFLWTSDQPIAETSSWQHTILTRDINATGRIRTCNPSKRSAADPRIRLLSFFSCTLFLHQPYLFICLDCPAFYLSVSTYNTHNKNTHALVGFEPATPASDRSLTVALDRSATGVGLNDVMPYIMMTELAHNGVFCREIFNRMNTPPPSQKKVSSKSASSEGFKTTCLLSKVNHMTSRLSGKYFCTLR
jgi:hypothetical protein